MSKYVWTPDIVLKSSDVILHSARVGTGANQQNLEDVAKDGRVFYVGEATWRRIRVLNYKR